MEKCKTIEEWIQQFDNGCSIIDAMSNVPSGWYMSKLEYDFGETKDFSENITMVGNIKQWEI